MMARVPLIEQRHQAVTAAQQQVFDSIVASRGSLIRPYQVLLHAPSIAEPLAETGARIRFGGSLPDHDRELVILTAAVVHGCAFEWDSHVQIAIDAGVRQEVLDHLRDGSGSLDESEELVISYVRTLCAASTVPAELFERARSRFGDSGVVELTATVGYYTLLAFVMGAADAC